MKLTHCKLDKKLQIRLLEFFVTQVTARAAADLLQIQPNSAALFYRKVRQIISWHLQQQTAEQFDGQVELDESYFGGVRKRKMGRATANKVIVFGILKRGGKVYTLVVENRRAQSLLPVIKEKIKPDSVVYTDSFRSYDVLDISSFHHKRINHELLFAEGRNHINGIENFWSQAKRTLRRYNGIDRKSFPLFLKECEFRFNYGTPSEQLKTVRLWCDI